MKWLKETWQESTAAEVYEQQNDFIAAIKMYLKAGLPSKAARYIVRSMNSSSNYAYLIIAISHIIVKTIKMLWDF